MDGGQRVWKSNRAKLTETFRKRRVCLQHSRKCSFFLYYYFQKIGQLHPCLSYLFWLNALPTYTHVWLQLFYLVSMQTINQSVDQIGGFCTCKRSTCLAWMWIWMSVQDVIWELWPSVWCDHWLILLWWNCFALHGLFQRTTTPLAELQPHLASKQWLEKWMWNERKAQVDIFFSVLFFFFW